VTTPTAELDFGDEPDVAPTPTPLPSTVPYNLGAARERMRGRLGFLLLGLIAVYTVGVTAAAAVLVRPFNEDTLSMLLAGVFTPLVTVAGTVVGFYFGSEGVKQS
jgi:hypothetical protein